MQLKLPTAEHDLFVFEAQESEGEICVSRYWPKGEAEDVDGITKGRLAWNCESGDPAWLEAHFVDKPMMVEEFEIRWVFRRAGGMVLTESSEFTVVAGPPFLKRRIEVKRELVEGGIEIDVAGGEASGQADKAD